MLLCIYLFQQRCILYSSAVEVSNALSKLSSNIVDILRCNFRFQILYV